MFLAIMLAELICDFSGSIERTKDFFMNNAMFPDIVAALIVAVVVIFEIVFYTYGTIHLIRDVKNYLNSIE